MCGVAAGNTACIQALLDGGASIDLASSEGDTALATAASSGHTPAVKLLLDRKAAAHLTNSNGQTAHELAESQGHGGKLGKKLMGKLKPKSKINPTRAVCAPRGPAPAAGRAAPPSSTSEAARGGSGPAQDAEDEECFGFGDE